MSRKRSKTKRVKAEQKAQQESKLTRKQERRIRHREFWSRDPKMIEAHNEEIVSDNLENKLKNISNIEIPDYAASIKKAAINGKLFTDEEYFDEPAPWFPHS